MNYLVQRGKVRQQVINVPEGLPEILSDITREVLRCQPTTECLCQFIIDYLHSVLETREKAQIAKSIIDRVLRTVEEIIADMCICEISPEKADELAMAMEECFKRFLERRRCDRRKEKEIIKFDEWDMLDELIEKCNFTEQEMAMSRPLIEDAYNRFVEAYKAAAENLEGTDALYEYFKARELKRVEQERINSAAVKIQATYRGFRTRKQLICDKLDERLNDAVYEYYLDEDKVRAAIKIQRYWRNIHKKICERYEVTYCGEEEQFLEGTSSGVCSPKSLSTSVHSFPSVQDVAPPEPVPEVQVEEQPTPAPPAASPAEEPAAEAEEAAPPPAPEPEPQPEPEPAPPAAPEEPPAEEAAAE